MLRSRAKLRIGSEEVSLDQLSNIIGIEPDFGHSLGDAVSSRSAGNTRRQTLLGIKSKSDESVPVEEQLRVMLEAFEAIKPKLEASGVEWQADLFCSVSSDNGQCSLEIDPSLGKALGDVNLKVIFDVYCSEE